MRYDTSNVSGHELTGFDFWSIYTLKVYLKCPQDRTPMYARERIYVGGTSELTFDMIKLLIFDLYNIPLNQGRFVTQTTSYLRFVL